MTLRRALTGGLFGLVIAAAAPMTAANAAPAPYPPGGDATLTVSSTTVTVGSSVTVTGSNYAGNSAVNVTSALANQGFAGSAAVFGSANVGLQRLAAAAVVVTTDGSGSFSTSVTLNEIGTVVITGAGTSASGAPTAPSVTVEVVGAGGAGGAGDGSGSGDGGASGVGGDGGLADTGADLKMPLLLGSILILVGGGAAVVGRRRRRGATTS